MLTKSDLSFLITEWPIVITVYYKTQSEVKQEIIEGADGVPGDLLWDELMTGWVSKAVGIRGKLDDHCL